MVDETVLDEGQVDSCRTQEHVVTSNRGEREKTARLSELSATWDVAEIPVDAEVCVGGDDAALEDLLADHGGEGVFGGVDVGLDQPRVLWPWKMVNHLFKQLLLLLSFCSLAHTAAVIKFFARGKLLLCG